MTINMKAKQLEILLHEFQLLAKTVLTQLQLVGALMQDNRTTNLYDEVETNEVLIDRLELKVREEVVFTIFQFNPMAADLRRIVAYQDLTTNLERVGDMLLNIIHSLKVIDLNTDDMQELREMLLKMMSYASNMVEKAMLSFSSQDAKMAYTVIQEDDKVDELFHLMKKVLQEKYMGKQVTKEDVNHIVHISSISHNLERIGDSATNMAEATIFITDGKDIKHGNQN